MEFEYKHEIKVSLFVNWQEDQEEVTSCPQVVLSVFVKNSNEIVGYCFLPYKFTIEEAEEAKLEVISNFERKIAKSDVQAPQSDDPDDITF